MVEQIDCALGRPQRALMIHQSKHVTDSPGSSTISRLSIASLALIALCGGCSAQRTHYNEKHEIKNLTVVFLDEQSLHERWKQIVGTDAVRFQSYSNNAVPLLKTVKGFYDFASNTLYCQKWDFEVCGHELHHAALGRFHQE